MKLFLLELIVDLLLQLVDIKYFCSENMFNKMVKFSYNSVNSISFDIGAIFDMLYNVDILADIYMYHTIYFTFLLGVDIATVEIIINLANNII